MSRHDRATPPAVAPERLHPPGGDPSTQPMVLGTGGVNAPASGRITYDALVERAFADPLACVAKEQADWFIPSTLPSRRHDDQRKQGQFVALVLDVDDGAHALEAVEDAMIAAVGAGAAGLIYSTKSATAAAPRWRIVVPLAEPLPGADYADTLDALCERMEAVSEGAIRPDRAMSRPGQIAFLPNAPDGDDPFIRAAELPGAQALSLGGDHAIITLREQRRAERRRTETDGRLKAAGRRNQQREVFDDTGVPTPVARFNERHRLADLLRRYRYEGRSEIAGGGHGESEHWRSRYQRSGSYATRLFQADDRSEYWVSLSDSDGKAGLGAACGKGSGRWGDAFDLFTHYGHGGDATTALAAWTAQCDRERLEKVAQTQLAVPSAGEGAAAPTDGDGAVRRIEALAAVETDDASLAAGWLSDMGDRLLRADDGGWRRFADGHWQHLDDDGAQAALSDYLCELADLRLATADEALKAGEITRKDHDKAKSLRHRLRSTAMLRAVFQQAKARARGAAADSFDADPFLIGLPGGGVLDLRTGEDRPGQPGDRVSLSVAFTPAPARVQPGRWLRFIKQIADGRAGWEDFLQRLCGYCLTGSTDAQSLFFMHGAGANGKSVLRSVMLRIAGDYGRTASAEVFLRRRGGGGHPEGIANLAGARLVMASELPAGRVWDDQTLKDVTGGERISARRLYGPRFEFTPRATVVVTGNRKPSFPSADGALARRLVLIEFRRVFEGVEIDPQLECRLLDEEGPAILRWVIDGARAWIAAGRGREGLVIPEDMQSAGRDYFDEEDLVLQFLIDQQAGDRQRWVRGAFIASNDLHHWFSQWLTEAGMRPWSQTAMSRQITGTSGGRHAGGRYGLTQHRRNNARGFTVERLLIDSDTDAEGIATGRAADADGGDSIQRKVVQLAERLAQNVCK